MHFLITPRSPLHCRQIAPAYTKVNGGTAIPLPATVMVQRRCPPDKVRPLPPTPNHTPCEYLPSIPPAGGVGNLLKNILSPQPPGFLCMWAGVCRREPLFTGGKQILVPGYGKQPPTIRKSRD